MSIGEARDLVVDQTGGEAGVDHVGLFDRGPAALRPHHPDRAIRLDPLLDLFQAQQVLAVPRTHEHQVDGLARFAFHDVGGPLAKEGEEAGVVEVDDRHLRAWLDSELVEQRPRRRNFRAQPLSSSGLPPRTALKTITPRSHPAYAPAIARMTTGRELATRSPRTSPRLMKPPSTRAPAMPPATAPTRIAAELRFFRP